MSAWDFQLIVSEILDHHNWGWPRNLHFKFYLSICLLKELTMSWWFYINATGCVGVTGYWSDKICIISPKENIVFVKLFGICFSSNILSSF